jgi:hypothetical protein
MNDLVSTCSYKFVNNNTVLLLLFTGTWWSGSFSEQTYSIKIIISQNNSIQVYYESINASSAPVGIAYIGNNSGSTSDDVFLTINGVTFNNISNQYGLLVGKTILLSYTEGDFTISTKQYTDAPFSLPTVVSNSGGAITYSSSNNNVATITGSTVTIVGSGTSTITATSAANGVYTSGSITANLVVAKGIPTINVTLKDGNNNTITPSNNIYTVVFNKNKIPRMDKLTLTTSSNNNASALSSVVQSGNSLVQYSSNGNIRIRNNGTVTIKVSQDETSNYVATEKTITLYITALAIQGRRPVFLRGL